VTPELLRLIAAQVCLHAAMTGTRLAAPLLALQQGHSAAAVGVLLALFALTQVFLALPAGRYADRHGLRRPLAIAVTSAVLGAALDAVQDDARALTPRRRMSRRMVAQTAERRSRFG